jgi:FAD/FMN-containing dehydrogenase
VQSRPSELLKPADEAQLAAYVARAKKQRVIGAGHSFTPLCETSGSAIDLSGMPETLRVDPDGATQPGCPRA